MKKEITCYAGWINSETGETGSCDLSGEPIKNSFWERLKYKYLLAKDNAWENEKYLGKQAWDIYNNSIGYKSKAYTTPIFLQKRKQSNEQRIITYSSWDDQKRQMCFYDLKTWKNEGLLVKI